MLHLPEEKKALCFSIANIMFCEDFSDAPDCIANCAYWKSGSAVFVHAYFRKGASQRVNVKRRSQIKIDEKKRQKKWDEHKQPRAKGKYWSKMKENIKPLAKSFKRERVQAALLCRTRSVIVSVRKRSFPVYEPTSPFLLFPRVFRAFTCRATDMADTGDDKSVRRRGNTRDDARTKKRENYCQSRT